MVLVLVLVLQVVPGRALGERLTPSHKVPNSNNSNRALGLLGAIHNSRWAEDILVVNLMLLVSSPSMHRVLPCHS